MRQIIKSKNKNNLNGFSLLELLVVLAIIGIILSFVVPNVINRPDEARNAKLLNDIKVIEAALGLYKLDYGNYPSENENLIILSEKKYISGVPVDPWKNPYKYRNPGKYGDVDVFSLGADNEEGGKGQDSDFGNWTLTSAEK